MSADFFSPEPFDPEADPEALPAMKLLSFITFGMPIGLLAAAACTSMDDVTKSSTDASTKAAAQAPAGVFPYTVHRAKLDNGLSVRENLLIYGRYFGLSRA